MTAMKTKTLEPVNGTEKVALPRELKKYVLPHDKLRKKLSPSKVDLSEVVVYARHNGK